MATMWQGQTCKLLGLFLMSPREVLVIVAIAVVIAYVAARRRGVKRRDRGKR